MLEVNWRYYRKLWMEGSERILREMTFSFPERPPAGGPRRIRSWARIAPSSPTKRVENESRSALDDILREGARRMLQHAIEAEVADYVDQHSHLLDPDTGRRLVVRNGRQPRRTIQSGLGDIPIARPRVHDRREGAACRCTPRA